MSRWWWCGGGGKKGDGGSCKKTRETGRKGEEKRENTPGDVWRFRVMRFNYKTRRVLQLARRRTHHPSCTPSTPFSIPLTPFLFTVLQLFTVWFALSSVAPPTTGVPHSLLPLFDFRTPGNTWRKIAETVQPTKVGIILCTATRLLIFMFCELRRWCAHLKLMLKFLISTYDKTLSTKEWEIVILKFREDLIIVGAFKRTVV